MNSNKIMKKTNSLFTNPLFIIIMILIALIIILAIFRSAGPFLTMGFGINAHIGDLKGSFELEAFDNQNSNKDAMFVMYYAEWCGHCKRTMPEFKKLMNEYKGNVKIVAINSEDKEHEELIKNQNIKGFPTIRYYPSGISDKFEEYQGGREYSDFVQYLGGVTGTPDQMPDQAAPIEHFRGFSCPPLYYKVAGKNQCKRLGT